MGEDKGKQRAIDPELVPAPLFSSRRPHNLPHIVDTGIEEPDVQIHESDDLFWNSVLEEKGEDVPEYDVQGRVQGTGRAYYVPRQEREEPSATGAARNLRRSSRHIPGPEELPAPRWSAPPDRQVTGGYLSPGDERNAYKTGLYLPLPLRSTAFDVERLEDSVQQGGQRSLAWFAEQRMNEFTQRPHTFRGGDYSPSEPMDQPRAMDIKLPPGTMDRILAMAQSDPIRSHGKPVRYEAEPSVGFKLHKERSERSLNTPPNFSFPLPAEYSPPRPSTAELEHAYDVPEPRRVSRDNHVAEQGVSTDGSGAGQSRFVYDDDVGLFRYADSSRRERSDYVQESVSTYSNESGQLSSTVNDGEEPAHTPNRAYTENTTPPHSPLRGIRTADEGSPKDYFSIPIRPHPDTPPPPPPPKDHHLPLPRKYLPATPPPRPQHSIPHPLNSPSPSPTSPSTSSLPSPPTSDENLEYYLNNHTPGPDLLAILDLYQRTMSRQAKSLSRLQRTVDKLTSSRDYYEQQLLPRAFANWQATNRENHALSAAVRAYEEENALLWDVVRFSKWLLGACWERDEAVLSTAKMVQVRRRKRVDCGLLERLVGTGDGRTRWGTMLKSPFGKDLEQLISVAQQNLKLFGEDLRDFKWKVDGVKIVRKDRLRGQVEEWREEGQEQEQEQPRADVRDV